MTDTGSKGQRPHVICHMAATIDGRIDGEALARITATSVYEETGALLDGDAWLCGRTTMQKDFAGGELFHSTNGAPAGPRPVHVARRAAPYAVAVDTMGRLRWSRNDIGGDHLICVVSEQAPAEYLDGLRKNGISHIVAGASRVDLRLALDLLGEHFGIRRLLLEGGGHINGGFAEQGLIDEVSLLLFPGIDGRRGIPTVFDGLEGIERGAIRLTLDAVERRDGDVLWLRYSVVDTHDV
jgi:2,5-diamino-6-(ribosylamino)-4(3H)-pyrimidinone 5'-phosphate reductase